MTIRTETCVIHCDFCHQEETLQCQREAADREAHKRGWTFNTQPHLDICPACSKPPEINSLEWHSLLKSQRQKWEKEFAGYEVVTMGPVRVRLTRNRKLYIINDDQPNRQRPVEELLAL
jgi:hypothetical protein